MVADAEAPSPAAARATAATISFVGRGRPTIPDHNAVLANSDTPDPGAKFLPHVTRRQRHATRLTHVLNALRPLPPHKKKLNRHKRLRVVQRCNARSREDGMRLENERGRG